MKRQITLFFIIVSQFVQAQTENEVSIFHRLLIFNQNKELLVLKIENTNFWVTPGLYQNEEQTLKKGLDSVASTFGLVIKDLELKGTFLLKRDINGKKSSSLRNVFIAKTENAVVLKPKGIQEVQWLSTSEAMDKINFPHINAMIRQITNYPTKIWGGTLLQFKENNEWKTKILEDFYEL